MSARLVFAISALANIGLALVWFLRAGDPAGAPTTVSEPGKKVITRTVVERDVSTADSEPFHFTRQEWRSIESEDYRQYIANLRSINCPEETIRDIIIADVNKLYAARFKAIFDPAPEKYWVYQAVNMPSFEKFARERQVLEKEKTELIQELLGIDAQKELRKQSMVWDGDDRERAFMEFLPEQKRRIVQESRDKARRLGEAAVARAKAESRPPNRAEEEEVIRIRMQSRDEMLAVLTPQEFEEYNLRTSATANVLRGQTIGFDPSQKEFTDIFRAQTEYNDLFKWTYNDPNDPNFQRRQAEETAKLEKKFEAILGEDRYREFQRVRDNDYKDLLRFSQQQEISKDALVQAYDIQKAAQKQLANLGNIPPDQKSVLMDQIKMEAGSELSRILGDKAYQSYRASRGQWLRTSSGPTPALRTVVEPAR